MKTDPIQVKLAEFNALLDAILAILRSQRGGENADGDEEEKQGIEVCY